MKLKKLIILFITMFLCITYSSASAKLVIDHLGEETQESPNKPVEKQIQEEVEENVENKEKESGRTIYVQGPPHGTVIIHVKIQFPDGMDVGGLTDSNDATREEFLKQFGLR